MDNKLDKFVNVSFFLMPFLALYWRSSVGVLLVLSFFIWLFYARKEYKNIHRLQKLFVIFGAGILITALISLIMNGWHSKGERELGRYLRFVLSFPLMAIILVSNFKQNFFWKGLAVGGILVGILAPVEITFFDRERAGAFGTQNEILYGDFCILFSFLSLMGTFWFKAAEEKVWMFLALLGAAGFFAGVICSGTRGAFVAIPVFGLLFLIFLAAEKYYKTLLSLFVLLAIFTWPVVTSDASKMVVDRFVEASDEYHDHMLNGTSNTSIGARLFIWKVAIEKFTENPILGMGTGKFRSAIVDASKDGKGSDYVQTLSHAHNEFLATMSTRGIVGLFFLLGVLCVPFYTALKVNIKGVLIERVCLFSIPLGFSIFAMTESIFTRNSPIGVYVVLVSLFLVLVLRNDVQAKFSEEANGSAN